MKIHSLEKSIGLLIGLSSLLPAAQITWQESVQAYQGDAADETFVSGKGLFIDAVNGGSAVDEIANGVLFSGIAGLTNTGGDGQTVTTPGGFITVNGTNANDGAFGAGEFGGDTSVGRLLDSAFWAADGVTLSGLTIGEVYEVQIFGNDARSNRQTNYLAGFGDGTQSGPVGLLQLNNSNLDGSKTFPETDAGDYIIGTFTADAATQSFECFGTNNGGDQTLGNSRAHINALQLRQLLPDEDDDGIPTAFENNNGLNPTDPSDAALDPDNDGLTNLREYQLGTNLTDGDSDDDNLLDGEEVDTYGTDPLDADTDDDTLNDDVEVLRAPATNALLADSDTDGLSDADEINIHFTEPTLADSDGDGVNDPTELFISLTDPNLDTDVPVLDPDSVDLLAYWDFNDGSNTAQSVDLINDYVGELSEGTTFSEDAVGHTGEAGDLAIYMGTEPNAGTGVTVELGEFFNLTALNDQFTISFWQKLDAGQPTGSTSSVGASRYGVDRAIMVHAPFTNGQIYFDHGGGTTNRINGAAPFEIDWQQWNHITLVKNGDAKEVWVNGSLAISGLNEAAVVENNHHTVFLGMDDLDRNIIGHLDDVAFYADPLNSTQILALANGADPQSMDAVLGDRDADGMPDSYEVLYGLNPDVNDADLDLDNDGLSNLGEFTLGTVPNDDDTDDDNYLDGVETNTGIWVSESDTGTNPFLPDTDGDELLDGVENPDLEFVDASQTGTDPNIVDSDGDTYSDGGELAFGSDPTNASSLGAVIPEIVLYYDFNGDSASRVEDAPDSELVNGAVLSADATGFSAAEGDQALDLGTVAGTGAHAFVASGDNSHFNLVETNNTVAVSWWQNRTGPAVSSAAFLALPVSGKRALQSHAPWNNGVFYVDVMGFRQTLDDPTTPDVWQHFVIQKDAEGTVELWIDGERTNQWVEGAADQQLAFSGAVYIGSGAGTVNMTGQLDDFAIFSGPIPGPHIQAIASGISVGDFYNLGPQPLVISDTTANIADNTISLTWNSKANVNYAVEVALDLTGSGEDWQRVEEGIASQGVTTTHEVGGFEFAQFSELFFRVVALSEGGDEVIPPEVVE